MAQWGNGGGFHLILGIGGISWAQKVEANANSPYGSFSGDQTDTGFAFSPTAGLPLLCAITHLRISSA